MEFSRSMGAGLKQVLVSDTSRWVMTLKPTWLTHHVGTAHLYLRDWSVITGRGGGYKIGNRGSETCCPPPLPSRQGKTFRAPLLKSGNFSCPSFNMAKTSSYRVKTTPKRFVPPPPFSMAKTFSAPPFHRGKTSLAPPSRFVAPPLPVISD